MNWLNNHKSAPVFTFSHSSMACFLKWTSMGMSDIMLSTYKTKQIEKVRRTVASTNLMTLPNTLKRKLTNSRASPMSRKWAISCKLGRETGTMLSIFVIMPTTYFGNASRAGLASNAQELPLQNSKLLWIRIKKASTYIYKILFIHSILFIIFTNTDHTWNIINFTFSTFLSSAINLFFNKSKTLISAPFAFSLFLICYQICNTYINIIIVMRFWNSNIIIKM